MDVCVARWRGSRNTLSTNAKTSLEGNPVLSRVRIAVATGRRGRMFEPTDKEASFRPRRLQRASQRPAGRDSRACFLLLTFLSSVQRKGRCLAGRNRPTLVLLLFYSHRRSTRTKTAGLRPRATPYSFYAPKKSRQKKAPDLLARR